jgi:hypothetical protein
MYLPFQIIFNLKNGYKKHFLVFTFYILSHTANSQVFTGLYSGSENLIGVLGGYTFFNKLSIGLKFSPANNFGNISLGRAGYLGPYCKFDFSEIKFADGYFGCKFYTFASTGIINPPSSSYYVNVPSGTVTNINYKTTFGGVAGLGAAAGNKSRLFIEIGFGKMPDDGIAVNSTDPYASATRLSNTSKAFTGSFYYATGLNFSFGRKK